MTTLYSTLYHSLGYDDTKYRLKLDYDQQSHQLRVTVDGQGEPWPRLVESLNKQLLVYSKGPTKEYTARRLKQEKEDGALMFSGLGNEFALKLDTETIGTYHITEDGVLEQVSHRPLTVGEIRRVGSFYNAAPYPHYPDHRSKEENDALLATAKKAVFTDFHTHSSGHISPEGLIQVAREHDAYYPVSLLKEAGIDTSDRHMPMDLRKDVKRVPFPPRDLPNMPDMVAAFPLKQLDDKDIAKLARKMAMPGDHQSTYSEMEHNAYRFRYPLTKDASLLSDTLKQTAREAMAHGVKHIELAMVGLDNPELLNIVHQTLHQMEQSQEFKDFSMHFMVGIPRSFSLPKIEELLEKTKILSQSPYITGVDFLGYEVNKTRQFAEMLGKFCDWANEDRPGFNVRMHAGENDKNLDNVKDFLDLAKSHSKLNFRVGHGVHGMNADTLKLAQELCADPKNPRLTIEVNPDSVIALNNIDDFKTLPFDRMMKSKIPFVIGSDSAGTYGTSAEQLGFAAYYAGLDEEGFKKLEEHQHHLVQRQRDYSRRMADGIDGWDIHTKTQFVDKLVNKLKQVPLAPKDTRDEIDTDLMNAKLKQDKVSLVENMKDTAELESRVPITIAGASGSRWAKINPIAQREVAIALDMLVHALDPDKTYITQGRAKPTGLAAILDNIVTHANEDLKVENREPFYNLGLIVKARFTEEDSYRHLTHLYPASSLYLDLPDAVVNHTFSHDGILITAGGAAFTRDAITNADIYTVNHPDSKGRLYVFANATGATQEKSKSLHPKYAVNEGVGLLEKIYADKPELFKAGFDISKLEELYQQSAARVDQYGYDAPPDPADQNIVEGQSISQERKQGK